MIDRPLNPNRPRPPRTGHADSRRGAARPFARSTAGAASLMVALALSLTSVPVAAAEAPLSSAEVRPGLYRIDGAGGASLLRVGADAVVLVDAKRAGAYPALMAEIGRLAKTARPTVAALVLTAAGPEQAGGAPAFVEAGVPVVVQRNALSRVAGLERARGASAPGRLVRYDMDRVVQTADLKVEVEHVGRARTGVDSVVYFRDLRVLAVGELYTAGTPEPDCAAGGSAAGWAAAIAHLLWFDFDLAVPSRGAAVGKPELVALQAALEARAAAAAAAGQADCGPAR
jgi:glyoxylase-like metal-dependent hydrolase (beta-lactamase superfamily II)